MLTIFFLSNLVSFNGQNYQKQKRPSDHSLFRLQNKFRKNSLISYALSDQVWWCNIKWFFSYSKNYICKFMQANSCYHELFHPCLSFWIWKAWNGSEKKKNWISREIKNIFHNFWRGIIRWKNKNLIENSRHKL